jgi:hypothetical protein
MSARIAVLDVYMTVAISQDEDGKLGVQRRRVDEGKSEAEGKPYRRWIKTNRGKEFLAARRSE